MLFVSLMAASAPTARGDPRASCQRRNLTCCALKDRRQPRGVCVSRPRVNTAKHGSPRGRADFVRRIVAPSTGTSAGAGHGHERAALALADGQQPKRATIRRGGLDLRMQSGAGEAAVNTSEYGLSPPAVPDLPRLALTISTRAEKWVRGGHPWVYDNSVVSVKGEECGAGQLAVVFDNRSNRFLAVGLYDPESPLRVRVLHSSSKGKGCTIDNDFWKTKVRTAAALRSDLAADTTTDGYRWINGESDGLPGFVLDRYADTVVAKVYTAAWLPHLEGLVHAIRTELDPQPTRLVLRLSRNSQQVAQTEYGLTDGDILYGPPLERAVLFHENGLTFEAEVLQGQKTGFFLDQRDNRARVEHLSAGAAVLNAFSFSGGFSLYAARGGATAVTSLDLSAHALDSAVRNFGYNQDVEKVQQCAHETVQGDCFEWLEGARGRNFDIVILDPPCLAKRQSEKPAALKAYTRLAKLGLGCLRPGGTLVAASCSAHVPADDFFSAVAVRANPPAVKCCGMI